MALRVSETGREHNPVIHPMKRGGSMNRVGAIVVWCLSVRHHGRGGEGHKIFHDW